MKGSRHDFVAATLLSGAAVLGVARSTSAPASAQPAPPTATKATIDPNTVRRRGVGFRGYDPARASEGFTLFTPTAPPNKTVYLIDITGNVVHTWNMPYSPGWHGYLTPRGTLFYNGHIPNASYIGRQAYMGGAAMEVDWNGRVLWEVRNPDHHHDGIMLQNGNILLLCSRPLPAAPAQRVKGGKPGTEQPGGVIESDYLVEMKTDGTMVWEWRAWEHLDPATDGITNFQDHRADWSGGNGISQMPDGNILMSFRNISTVIMIERKTGDIFWKLGAPPLSGQHAPYLLPNGHVLLFDNGPDRLDESLPYSRVLEIDPATKAIVWKYQDTPVTSFFNPREGNARRLPSGNTLINEARFGRFFEVTSAGDVVWEYVNPHFGGPADKPQAQSNDVFRVYRYTAEEIRRARATTSIRTR